MQDLLQELLCVHGEATDCAAKESGKKPIISSEFCVRFQVDIIDMRTMRENDVYEVMQHWIMTGKDHSTGLVYLAALSRKTAVFVANKLEKYFGFVEYPHIFHTGM